MCVKVAEGMWGARGGGWGETAQKMVGEIGGGGRTNLCYSMKMYRIPPPPFV